MSDATEDKLVARIIALRAKAEAVRQEAARRRGEESNSEIAQLYEKARNARQELCCAQKVLLEAERIVAEKTESIGAAERLDRAAGLLIFEAENLEKHLAGALLNTPINEADFVAAAQEELDAERDWEDD